MAFAKLPASGRSHIMAEINITPLTGIVLVLLIIFMVTSVAMVDTGAKVMLPEVDSTTSDCSTYFVRDAQFLVRVMSTNPSFLQTAVDGQVKNYRDWGIPLGRRMRALKLWFVIRDQGVMGLQARIRRDLAHAQWLAGEIGRAPHWKILAPVRLQTLVLRHEPPGLDAARCDAHNRAWAQAVNESGEGFLTPTALSDRWAVRVSLGAANTEHEHVVDLWRLMQQCAGA